MILHDHDGLEYKAHFTHVPEADTTIVRLHVGDCLYDPTTRKCLSDGIRGSSRRKHNDPFTKAVGRKYALKSALKDQPKVLRSALWGSYWSVCNVKDAHL